MEQPEKALVPLVVELLANRLGHPIVLSGSRSVGFSGKGEFAIRSTSTHRVRRADVVAARWNFDGSPLTAAVECKATVAAVYDALGQAVDYQSVFDEVYVATPLDLEALGFVRSTLVELGIGHITVAVSTGSAQVTVAPAPRWPSRFQPHRRSSVDLPLALGLAFQEASSASGARRHGFFEQSGDQGIWYAEEVMGHRQWSCNAVVGGAVEVVSAGVNVEHIADIREIVAQLDVQRFSEALRPLPPEYQLRVEYNPNPRPPGALSTVVIDLPANDVDPTAVVKALTEHPTKTRPQLSVQRHLPEQLVAYIRRSDWAAFLVAVREDLRMVMESLAPDTSRTGVRAAGCG